MNQWELMSLAQHHGMATRFLDWTENPLLAMWFAVAKPAKEKNSQKKAKSRQLFRCSLPGKKIIWMWKIKM